MTGPRIALPLPAWKNAGSPAKISLACSGRVKRMSGRRCGTVRMVKTSPYLRCIAGTKRCRKRSSPAVCTIAGQRGPGGSPAPGTRGSACPPKGRIRENRRSASRETVSEASVLAITPA